MVFYCHYKKLPQMFADESNTELLLDNSGCQTRLQSGHLQYCPVWLPSGDQARITSPFLVSRGCLHFLPHDLFLRLPSSSLKPLVPSPSSP